MRNRHSTHRQRIGTCGQNWLNAHLFGEERAQELYDWLSTTERGTTCMFMHIGNQKAHATKDVDHANQRDDIERVSELLIGDLHSSAS
jgi:hypothetical protein